MVSLVTKDSACRVYYEEFTPSAVTTSSDSLLTLSGTTMCVVSTRPTPYRVPLTVWVMQGTSNVIVRFMFIPDEQFGNPAKSGGVHAVPRDAVARVGFNT